MVIKIKENAIVFDYITLSHRYGIDANYLKRIIIEVNDEFKDDENDGRASYSKSNKADYSKKWTGSFGAMSFGKVYLDTSVISALFDERTPERQHLTNIMWQSLEKL